MASIHEVGCGDEVKVVSGRWEKIAYIEKNSDTETGRLKSWVIVTESGKRVGMMEALRYRKAGEE